ncbi:dna repair and recombination protein rad26 [Lichtheimia corymbifera JMRC:FSU:9682]|uniref:Dna repair and recombination protein rad26 n=1 Tax=Lichtheimia corymbifera JMRC:FSU:9682 TaxID=1263082 RepID=A0A068SCM4_9FUNG|nr:dna repair and recombination protein rad26 [Lichtheimia corymbifera JMRC:FSU:9682]
MDSHDLLDPSPSNETMNSNNSDSACAGQKTSEEPTIDNDIDEKLQNLGVNLMDQNALERQIMVKADKAIAERDNALDYKRLTKARKEKDNARKQLEKLQRELGDKVLNSASQERLLTKINIQTSRLQNLDRDENDILTRMRDREKSQGEFVSDPKHPANETRREFLIRTGKITPFTELSEIEKGSDEHIPTSWGTSPVGVSLGDSRSGGRRKPVPVTDNQHGNSKRPPSTKQRSNGFRPSDKKQTTRKKQLVMSDDEYEYTASDSQGDEDYISDTDTDDSMEIAATLRKTMFADDGDEGVYQKRMRGWLYNRKRMLANIEDDNDDGTPRNSSRHPDQGGRQEPGDESYDTSPSYEDIELGAGLRIPREIWMNLLDYQKTCVKWLWELHSQKVGGIIGDEMGLGKTVQMIAFISGLYHSKILGPGKATVVVCPATVMKQWVEEFHRWWPPIRVAVLHATGSVMRTDAKQFLDPTQSDHDSSELEDVDLWRSESTARKRRKGKGQQSLSNEDVLRTKTGRRAHALVERFVRLGGVLVTTYNGVQAYRQILLKHRWGYVVLDEGHKIRNPDSETTLACKQFKTSHRIILSGTPIQNNLKELWSLFDFIFPGRLGTLPVFQTQFSVPITIGGYANATNMQVQTAYRCACVLRDLINPYLLRRMKVDVATNLPAKNEQVLFCKLTPIQREAYLRFIHSKDMDAILERRRQVLYGIDVVRKICNHPDLITTASTSAEEDPSYGDPEKSGKLVVVCALLRLWKSQNHKVLLFSQTRQMLDIIERVIKGLGFNYLRMDGNTAVGQRMALVNDFNTQDDIYVFLLTTKVGGLGLNLTGADRVIIFDPDWNPSTDMQARERAWRLGQRKDVTIYRLMTSGTIEEKIYHRQIYKQFLTNKILKDPKQKRFFDASNLKALFTLGDDESSSGTETGQLFKGTEMSYQSPKPESRSKSPTDDKEQLLALNGVANIEQLAENPKEQQAGSSETHAEDNVLKSLFEMTGIQSALQHDQIMDSGQQERVLADSEAALVAKHATEVLKESRRERRKMGVATPTWTGRSGVAGAPVLPSNCHNSPYLPSPRFGQKSLAPISPVAGTESLSPKFGSGAVPGFGGEANSGQRAMSSQVLLAQLRKRKSPGE